MPFLQSIRITFNTHGDNKNGSTMLHVFIKNRLNSSLSPERNSDFISNCLSFIRYLTDDLNDDDPNPYLAFGLNLAPGQEFENGSSWTFENELTLRSSTISVDEIMLPVVNVHILADDNDRWIFDYTVTLTFDNAAQFSFSSNVDGVQGIILDQDNRNHSGIGIENPLRTLPLPAPAKPLTNAVLKKVKLEFATHNDDKKDSTRVNVHIANRLSPTSAQDIAIGLGLFDGEAFPDPSHREFVWSSDEGSLASNGIRLADMMLPVVYIVMVPGEDDDNERWIFDYRVTFEFGDPQNFNDKWLVYSWRTSGIILDQDINKHKGVYQGPPFPTVAPPTAPTLTQRPIDHIAEPKVISLSFLRQKLEEFINNRNGADDSDNPPLNRIVLDNSETLRVRLSNGGVQTEPLPESYVDMSSITAGKDKHLVGYISGPMSLGQLYAAECGDSFISNVKCANLSTSIDVQQPAPITFKIDFATGGGVFVPNDPVTSFIPLAPSISLKLTLDVARTVNQFGKTKTVIDALSWVNSTNTAPFIEIDPPLPSQVEEYIRGKLVGKLTEPGTFGDKSHRDAINSMVSSWLLGGIADDDGNTDENNALIDNMWIENANPELGIPEDTLHISYAGPRNVFVMDPPADWPKGHDFSPGTLANIDHIVVLTMENRSFDHILGYLSLPIDRGGRGRQEVDGLKGGESNSFNGVTFTSFPLQQTLFAPDPPHSHEPVHHAINGGRMDGFVKSFAEARGATFAGNIMGHHTGATVPQYDALARDFAIGHRWFASHPGPTFCNRFYELTGRLNLDVRGFWELDNSSPGRPVYTDAIFDHLNGAVDPISGEPVTWRYFEQGYCFLRFFERYTFDTKNVVAADDPEFGFFACARDGRLPSVSFIDPHFVELPPDATCDGPPADVSDGQAFVQKVVEAVIAGPKWNKTLLLIVYDEHGGFYDHVPPPPAPRVSNDIPISTYGVRVPAIVISPWVGAGAVFGHDGPATGAQNRTQGTGGGGAGSGGVSGTRGGLYFDHTSTLKTIARRFLSKNTPPYMGARYAAANDLSMVLGTRLRQPQFLPYIRYRLQFIMSQMMLEVSGANPARGAALDQGASSDLPAQDFSFEDAGGGFVYIRSHVSNLYLTVAGADPTGGTTAERPTAAADAPPLSIIQDIKYPPNGTVATGPSLQRFQKWKVAHVVGVITDLDTYLISSESYPDKVLQPLDFNQPASAIVLGDIVRSTGVLHTIESAWKISSPLFGGGSVNSLAVGPRGRTAPQKPRQAPTGRRRRSRSRSHH